jgi:hypothetical protein
MTKKKKGADVFRTVGEFESEMFPDDVAQRNQESEYEHPAEAGVRLAEDVLSGLRSKTRKPSGVAVSARLEANGVSSAQI